MLNTSKTMTINGTSKLESGEVIATMHCSISRNGSISKSENISNATLYEQNTELVRADIDEFTAYCRQIEEEMKLETETDEEETE